MFALKTKNSGDPIFWYMLSMTIIHRAALNGVNDNHNEMSADIHLTCQVRYAFMCPF